MPIVGPDEIFDFPSGIRIGERFGRVGLPAPQPGSGAGPEIAVLLKQRKNAGPEAAILPVTVHGAAPDCAEPPVGGSLCPHPHGSVVIFHQRPNYLFREFRVADKPPVLPTRKPGSGADPKPPVAGHEKPNDVGAGKTLAGRRIPRNLLDAIETKQAEFRTQPEIPVWRLSNRLNRAIEETVPN